MPQSTASEQRVRAEQMRDKALTLRRAGASFAKIGRELGISKKNAHKHVTKALAELKKLNTQLAEEVRDLELQRLDEMQTAIYSAALVPEPVIQVVDGKPQQTDVHRDRQLRCIDRVIRIQERRAALLGIDAPKKLEQSGPGGGPIPVQASALDLRALSVPQLQQLRELVAAATPEDPGKG